MYTAQTLFSLLIFYFLHKVQSQIDRKRWQTIELKKLTRFTIGSRVKNGAVALANFFAGRQPCFLLKWHQKRLRFRRHSL